jgi:hypothetical protein
LLGGISTQSKDVAPPQDSTDAVFNLEALVGELFLMDEDEDGQKVHAQILQLLQDHKGKVQDYQRRLKFLVQQRRSL